MKSILGFCAGDPYVAPEIDITPSAAPDPVRSLVSVRFIDDGRVLTYYNDRFVLEPGDLVFAILKESLRQRHTSLKMRLRASV